MFGYTFAGLGLAYFAVQTIGIAAGGTVADQSAEGVRRKLVKGGDGQGAPTAALVHFGWAPSSRAAHEMYDRVVRYGEGHSDVAGK